jgi:hypothetical protein
MYFSVILSKNFQVTNLHDFIQLMVKFKIFF